MKVLSCHVIFNEPAMIYARKLKLELVSGDFKPVEGDVFVVFGAHCVSLQLYETQKRLKVGYIIMNSEQPDSHLIRDKFYISLLKSNPVFDYSQCSTDYLKRVHGVNVLSHYFFEFMKIHSKEERKIDILFVGSICSERQKIQERLISKYPNKKIHFVFDWSLKSPNDLKNAYLNSKYVINIPIYNSNSLETHRINNALSCGCHVVSHNKTDSKTIEFYDDYIHFVNDILDFDFDEEPEDKKPYEDMIKILSQMLLTHNLFVMNQITEKNKSNSI
jgi:hypothetical protein